MQVVQEDKNKVLRNAAARGGRLLELGSGHGLGGLAAACVSGWKRVVLTDKDTRLVQLIAENCQRNEKWLPRAGLQSLPKSHTNSPTNSPPVVVARHGVWAHSASHDSLWAESEGQGYDVVIAAGCTYSKCIVDALFTTVRAMLSAGGTALIVHQSRDLKHLFSGVSVRKTLKEKPQGFFRGSKRSEHLQPIDVARAAEAQILKSSLHSEFCVANILKH
jgi:predicted nicotinamide N-methyase